MSSHICPVCGAGFRTYASMNRRYCSRACYIRASFGGEQYQEVMHFVRKILTDGLISRESVSVLI